MADEAHTLPAEPESVIATDNRIFRTLAEWDVDLSAAPVDLMSADMEILEKYTNNDDILNMGNHREPDMEMVTAAEPDLILNGQRSEERRVGESVERGGRR